MWDGATPEGLEFEPFCTEIGYGFRCLGLKGLQSNKSTVPCSTLCRGSWGLKQPSEVASTEYQLRHATLCPTRTKQVFVMVAKHTYQG